MKDAGLSITKQIYFTNLIHPDTSIGNKAKSSENNFDTYPQKDTSILNDTLKKDNLNNLFNNPFGRPDSTKGQGQGDGNSGNSSRYSNLEYLFRDLSFEVNNNEADIKMMQILNMCAYPTISIIILSEDAAYRVIPIRTYLQSLRQKRKFSERIEMVEYDIGGKILEIKMSIK